MKLQNSKYNHALLILVLVLSFLQCRTDEINTELAPSPIGDFTNVSFLITVNGNDNQLLPNVTVQIENISPLFNADENGIIQVENITIPKSGIKAELTAEGYEDQTIRLLGASDVVTPVFVKMVKLKTKLVNTGSEGEISDGCFLELPTSLEYPNGDSYTGAVQVRSIYLNTDNEYLLNSTLGNMQALNKKEDYKLLGSEGLIKISLYDESGNQIFIPEGSTAKIKIPLTQSQQYIEASNLNTWSLNENSAIWSESGSVSKENDMLVSEIDQLSWINFGPSHEFYQARLSFYDVNDRAVPFLRIRLFANDVLINEMYINNANDQSVSLPVGEELSIEYTYGDKTYTQLLGNHNGIEVKHDVVLEDLVAYLVMGTMLNCQNQNVQSSYGILTQGNTSAAFNIKNGAFSYLNILEDHIVKFVDNETNQSNTANINNIEDDIFLGDISVCEEDLARVSGYILLDSEEDGVGDTPLANQVVKLSSDDLDLQLSTDPNGYYEFSFIQMDSVYLQLEFDQNLHVIYQSGDASPESIEETIGYSAGYGIKNLSTQHDEDNNYILINQGSGTISGKYYGDTNGDGIGDVPLEWQVIHTLTEDKIGYVDQNGEFSITRNNGHGDLWTGFYDWIEDYDATPDPDGDDSALGPNGKIPYFINSNELDQDNNIIIDLDFSAIVVQVLEDIDGDGIGDIPIVEGEVKIKHITGGSGSVSSIVNLSDGKYAKAEFGMSLAELHEVTISLPFDYEIISIEDLSEDNDPSPTAIIMNIRTLGAEWDGGNTFTIRRI